MWRDTRVGTVVRGRDGARATVRGIGQGGWVRISLDDGAELDIRVHPDAPVEIELTAGEGTANMEDLLGCTPATPRPRTGHRTTYVLPTKWTAGRKIVDGEIVGTL